MKEVTISADSTVLIYDGKQTTGRLERQKGSTSVYILENVDGALVTFGTYNSSDVFKPFPDGLITDAGKINHGSGISLYVQISGITANPVELGISV